MAVGQWPSDGIEARGEGGKEQWAQSVKMDFSKAQSDLVSQFEVSEMAGRVMTEEIAHNTYDASLRNDQK